MRALALAGLGVACYLAAVSFSGDSVVGCGDGAAVDCDHVLSSRWARWLGVPVGLPAACAYLCMSGASWYVGSARSESARRAAWSVLAIGGVAATGSALWFVALMVQLGSVCFYCLAVHACSLTIAVLALVAGPFSLRQSAKQVAVAAVAVAVLVIGQLAVKPKTYDVERVEHDGDSPSLVLGATDELPGEVPGVSDPPPAVDAPEPPKEPLPSRMISVLDGKVELDVYALPVLGSPEAEHVLVEVFDYTCPHCRTLSGQLAEARDRFGDRLAIVPIVVPLNSACNRHIRHTAGKHKSACVLAKLAVAVWRVDPDSFEEYHEWLFAEVDPRSAVDARAEAARLVTESALDEELDGWKVDERLRLNVDFFEACGFGMIPKLLFRQIVLRGEMETADELCEKLQQELGL